MQLFSALLSLVLIAISVQAHPVDRAIFDSVTVLDDILVFDAAAFPDPANPGSTLVGLQSFVSLRQLNLDPLLSGVTSVLKSTLGLDIGDKISTVGERIKLFGAVGLSGKAVVVNIGGCGQVAELPGTSGLPDLGMVLGNVSVGQCQDSKELTGQVNLSSLDSRQRTTTIFNSPDSGFGVISGMFITSLFHVAWCS